MSVVATSNAVNWKTLHPVGKFFIVVFLIVLFEGAIRKWIWGSATIPLLGLRDLIVVFAVFWGFTHRYFNARANGESILIFWSVLITFWIFVQVLSGLQPAIVGVIGFRFWVLYLWFALLCAKALNWQDIEYLFKIFSLTLLFMVPLALLQFMSPTTSFINKQAGGDAQSVFTVINGIVRTTGTFSFTVGYTTYLAFITPVILWLMSGGLKSTFNPLLRVLVVSLFYIGVFISGSRGAIITTLFFTAIWFLTHLVTNRIPKISAGKVVFGLAGGILLLFLLFPVIERSYEANTQRFETAAASEDVSERVINMFMGDDDTWERFSLLGNGIGAGANASRVFLPPSNKSFLLGEKEIDKIINEGGFIGLIFALVKWLLIAAGLLSSCRIFIRYNEFLPLSIWIVITINLPTAAIVGQITVHAFSLLLISLGFLSITCWHSEKNRRQGLNK